MKRILICGLPGAGKTFLATELVKQLGDAVWFNADAVREEYNDWDFSPEGRLRQMERMKRLSSEAVSSGKYAITDFVCPTKSLREDFDADFVIWMDTLKEGRFEDTNRVFQPLDDLEYDVIITADEWWNALHANVWSKKIIEMLNV